jgi:hypothetical protein
LAKRWLVIGSPHSLQLGPAITETLHSQNIDLFDSSKHLPSESPADHWLVNACEGSVLLEVTNQD